MGALPAHYAGQGDVVGLAGDGFHALLVEGDADHGGIGAQAGEQLVVVAAAVAQAPSDIVEGGIVLAVGTGFAA